MFLLLCVVFLFVLIYTRGTKRFNYWKKKGVKYCKPTPFFGNAFRKIFQLVSPTDLLVEIYQQFPNERCVGCFEGNSPALVLRDPELVKQVLIADFRYFYPKGINAHQTEPLMNNLFSADGDLWKLLRQKLSVAFTTGKLKSMFPLILERTERMQKIVIKAAETSSKTNVRELLARYTTDVITSCGFGVDTDALNGGSSSMFRKLGQRIFQIKLRDIFVTMSKTIAPSLTKNWYHFAPEIESMMHVIVKYVMNARDSRITNRKDFMDILLDIKEKGKLVGDSIVQRDAKGLPQKAEIIIDETLMIAQAFILFGAGYETSSSATSYLLHQLAYHPEKQKKCQDEIDHLLQKHGTLTYDSINELVYLKAAFHEALRMYPSIGFLIRQCAKKYTFKDMDLTIDAGTMALIPIQAIHNDEKYFEEPEKFKPERFLTENSQNIKHVFLPFGAGPRACIGARLGSLLSMTGLASILSEFSVIPTADSRRHLITDPTTALVQNIKGGIPLAFVPRQKN